MIKAKTIFDVKDNWISLYFSSSAVLSIVIYSLIKMNWIEDKNAKFVERIKNSLFSLRYLPIFLSLGIVNFIIKKRIYKKVYEGQKRTSRKYFEKEAQLIIDCGQPCFSHR
jgi:hypothetical protein